MDKNKIGLTVNDYKCKRCGYLNAVSFVKNMKPKQCFRCRKLF